LPSVSRAIHRSINFLDSLYQRTIDAVSVGGYDDEHAFRVHLLEVAECCDGIPEVMTAWRAAEVAATRWYANASDEPQRTELQNALLALAVELQNAAMTQAWPRAKDPTH
jgi:hypothetical protein